jgi:carboxyl-terminal processing protease
MKRRAFLGALAAAPFARAAAPGLSARSNVEDFDALWRAIDAGYAYFDGSRIAWKRARELWRPRARAARTRSELVLALEGAIAHLCDDAVTLSEQVAASARLVPSQTDVWAEWKGADALITAVRPFSDADVAGVHPGHVVTHVDGVPVAAAVRDRLRPLGASGPAAMAWALRKALAGPRTGSVRLSVRAPPGPALVEVERSAPGAANGPPLIARRMGEERDVGYIRVRNVLGDPGLVERFDAALVYLTDTRALILDLRETPGGGERAVCEALLSHFVEQESPWQVREGPGHARATDTVKPSTARYRAPLFVLVDRWTAGEAEALAAGLEGAARATLVGTPMAGLRGEARAVTLPHCGIAVRFPGERAFHVNGTPRELVRPSVEVDLVAPSGGPGDPILYQGLKTASAAPAGRSAPR